MQSRRQRKVICRVRTLIRAVKSRSPKSLSNCMWSQAWFRIHLTLFFVITGMLSSASLSITVLTNSRWTLKTLIEQIVSALKWSSVKQASYQQKDMTERLIKSKTKSVKVINGSRAKHIHDNNKHLTAGLCFRAEILNTEWGEMSHFSLNPDTTNGQQTYKWSSFFPYSVLFFLLGPFTSHIGPW